MNMARSQRIFWLGAQAKWTALLASCTCLLLMIPTFPNHESKKHLKEIISVIIDHSNNYSFMTESMIFTLPTIQDKELWFSQNVSMVLEEGLEDSLFQGDAMEPSNVEDEEQTTNWRAQNLFLLTKNQAFNVGGWVTKKSPWSIHRDGAAQFFICHRSYIIIKLVESSFSTFAWAFNLNLFWV